MISYGYLSIISCKNTTNFFPNHDFIKILKIFYKSKDLSPDKNRLSIPGIPVVFLCTGNIMIIDKQINNNFWWCYKKYADVLPFRQ
jgi:hypothetical protein